MLTTLELHIEGQLFCTLGNLQHFARLVSPRFLSNMSDINGRMCRILVDWLYGVHEKFKLLPETLYLAVSLVDWFLVKHPQLCRQDFQLAGMTTIWIAAKYVEISGSLSCNCWPGCECLGGTPYIFALLETM